MTQIDHTYRWPARGLRSIRRFGRPAQGEVATTRSNVRTAAIAMVIAIALFAVFGSNGMRQFSRDLPGNRLTDVLVNGADRWHALMLQTGPAHVGPLIREAFSRLQSATW
jgi:hypothetical protein